MNPRDSAVLEPASPPVVAAPHSSPAVAERKPPVTQHIKPAACGPALSPPASRPSAKAARTDEEQSPQSLRERLTSGAPGWLVSLVVHLMVLVVLALWVIVTPPKREGTVLTADAVDDHESLVEAVELRLEKFEETPQVSTAFSAPALAPAAISVGAESALSDASEVDLGEVDVGGVESSLFGAAGTALAESKATGGEASFFGVKSKGRRFVFVVDSSNSMRRGKFDAAKEELLYAVRRLSPDQFFYVIFFDHDAERMKLTPGGEPDPTAVPATTANIKRLETWLATVQNELRTDPGDAMKFAVEMLPDAIYLLSDGVFTDRGLTERFLAGNNFLVDPVDGRKPKVTIHTIAFWSRDGEDQMRRIATLYGGTYRFVEPAKK